ncbi:hypothetical protein [Polynucleobacter sp. MG-27-Goln-C1]|uniref:hypothetical protein n=1 Tax=Polynucleobacter sp. MG-27-Goln-C1 TaxID=1819726 RepID=UPI001C0E86BF|nr:hypothetical protein [Polynucleobacter sp. MG-27-Goln-C1]MBU3613046.1 hypothetical protein [Polynucleobacter sp. MG-27-Goln-C1]
MINKFSRQTASVILLLFLASSCFADSYGPIDFIEPTEKNEIWLNPGLLSYHFDQSRNFNAVNYGFGAEYKFSSVASLTAGTFRNSNYHQSNYIGAYWQPIAIGPINIGVVAGGFNGYPSNNNGGWFPAILPAFTVEGKWVGLNLIVIPTIGDRVSGSLSFQLKFKAFD